MNKIEELKTRMKEAVESKAEGDGLGYLNYGELTKEEKIAFMELFKPLGSDLYTTTFEGKKFVIQIYNYE